MDAIRPWGPGIHSQPMFGHVFGLGLDTAMTATLGALALRGRAVYPGNSSADDFDWSLFINGDLKQTQTDPSVFQLPRPGQAVNWRADVLGLLRDSEASDPADCGLFRAIASGAYARLSWTDMPDDADFDAYLLYWDEGASANTLLATITDAKQYVTGPLASGTYGFWLLYRDAAGNIGNGPGGDNGYTCTVRIRTPPNPPTAALVAPGNFAAGVSRDVAFTVTAPVVATGVVEYLMAVNQLPCLTDLPFAETGAAFLRPVTVGANTIHVYAGTWALLIFTVNKYGQLSTPATLAFRYVDSGAGGLTYGAGAAPAKITSIYAVAGAAGAVTVTAISTVGAGGGVRFYRDGVAQPDVPYASAVAGVYTLAQTGLVNGQAYSYVAAAYDALGVLGEASHAVVATADSLAPAGDQVLTAEVL